MEGAFLPLIFKKLWFIYSYYIIIIIKIILLLNHAAFLFHCTLDFRVHFLQNSSGPFVFLIFTINVLRMHI